MPKGVIETHEMDNVVPELAKINAKVFPSIYAEESGLELNGKDYLKEIGQVVVEDFKLDLASRSEWEENKAKELELFLSYLPPKSSPWKDCSNVNLPFLTIAAIQFQSRAVDALIPPKEIVKVLAVEDSDVERSDRVSKYMNYNLLYKMDSFEEDVDKLLMQLPIIGSSFKKTYYDPITKKDVSSCVSAVDVVVNYGASNLEKAQRVTHILTLSKNEIRKRVRDGLFIKEAWDFGHGNIATPISRTLKDSADKVMGITDNRVDRSVPRYLLEQHRDLDINGDGIEEPYVVTVDYEEEKVIRITSREYISEDDKLETINYFTHYVFLPNPEGFYGIGYGNLLRGLNEAANTIVNEVIDSGSLANLQGGFVSKRSGTKKGQLSFKMGEYKEVDTYVDDIRKAIYNFDFKGPNQTLYATLGLLYEYAKLVTSISETMTGQLPASDTPASTVLALIEEGRKVYSAIHKRCHRAFKRELEKIARLNSVFLDEKEYFRVLGEGNLPTGDQEQVGRADFAGNLDVIPVSDATITSRAERVMKAEQLRNVIGTNPSTANSAEAQENAAKYYLNALDIPDVNSFFPPPSEPQDVDPVTENAEILKEQPVNVIQEQDHLHHIEVHDELVSGAFADEMSSNSKKLYERHRQEHVAGLYLAQNMPQEGEIGNEGI